MADLLVAGWDRLSSDEQDQIRALLIQYHNIDSQDVISDAGPGARPMEVSGSLLCEIACNATAVAAASACSLLTGGVLIAVCLGGVEAARQLCLSKC